MNNNQTAFDIDELYFKANNDMAVILNMVRIASLSKKKKGKLLAAIEQKILDTMGGYPPLLHLFHVHKAILTGGFLYIRRF